MMQSTWEQRKHIETRIRDLLHLPSDTDLKTVNSMTLLQGCYQYVGERILAAAVKARNVMAGNPCSAETTQKESPKSDQRHILYTTMEILPGRTIANNIQNLPEGKAIESLLTDCGLTLDALENLERDPSLGNGGLGRLAACLLESATAGRIPFTVSVLRFRTGLFRQEIVNGCQTEEDDIWLDENGHYAFEIVHPEEMQAVQFAGQGGKVLLVMIPCDIPMIGADGYCNVIRSWKVGQVLGAVSPEQAAFYHKLDEKLYPDDSQEEGRWLRLAQEYALSAATVGYALDCCKKQGWDIHTLPEHFCYHINDTHAVLMIPECMRRLMKEYSLSYDEAWQIAGRSFVYTNHTILAEALEKWPISLMEARLPEIYGVIHQMHDRFKAEIFKTYDDSEKEEKLKQMAILYDHQVHMAHLAIYASSHVNGVARIHTDILCRRELRAFYEHMPEKFVNVTNGVTQRKFVGHANPPLAQWFTTLTGNQAWRSDLTVLQGMETFAQDPQLQKEFMAIRLLPDREKTARRQESRKVYLTCSRQIRTLTKEELGVWEALKDCDMNQLCQYSRDTLERFAAMCAYEEGQNQRVEGLLHSGLAQIANYDDVIVSFLGSHRCNLKCKYCFSDHRFQALSTMTDNEMVLITDMLTADRKDLNLHVDNNLGGEPLLDFQAVKDRHNTMVAYHKTRGIKASFGLLTNGTLLGEGHLDWLRTHLPYVGFSVDGDPKTHDKIRRDAGDFATYERVARGIRLLQESKWPVDTGVSAVISKYNMDILGMQKSLRDDLSVSNIVMKPVRAASESDFALNYDCLDSLKEGYRAFFTYLLEEGKKGNLIPLYTMLQPLDYAARFLLRVFFGDRYIVKRCGSGEHIFSVADDGKVYPCDSFNGVEGYEIANMTEGIHNRPGYQVPMVMDENPAFGCKDCFARYLCGGICQYVQYLNHHRHNDVTRMECELARFLAEEAILFWDTARSVWTREQMAQVRERIQTIGFTPAEDGAFFYAPC